jgi:hypothetical protein
VQQCILEPGGTLSFIGKKPLPEEVRHQEIVSRLDRLTAELARARGGEPAPSH